MADQLLPVQIVLRDTDAAGTPLAGGTAFFVQAGTTSAVSVYSDEALTTPLTNPVVADSTGTIPQVWFGAGTAVDAYIYNSAGVQKRFIENVARFGASATSAASIVVTPTAYVADTNVQAALATIAEDLALESAGPRSVATGGTGANNATTARTNLGVVLQTSNTDTTSGSVMTVGAFGLGINDTPAPVLTDLNANRISGLLRYAAGATGAPDANAGALVHLARLASAGNTSAQFQIAYSTNGNRFSRRLSSGTWSNWFREWTAENLIGTVAQSGGVPTGEVFEESTWDSGNGRLLKLTSGAAFLWHIHDDTGTNWTTASGSFFARGSDLTLTWPFTFAAAPAVTATSRTGASPVHGAGLKTVSATSATLTPWIDTSTAAGTAKSIHTHVIGRWF